MVLLSSPDSKARIAMDLLLAYCPYSSHLLDVSDIPEVGRPSQGRHSPARRPAAQPQARPAQQGADARPLAQPCRSSAPAVQKRTGSPRGTRSNDHAVQTAYERLSRAEKLARALRHGPSCSRTGWRTQNRHRRDRSPPGSAWCHRPILRRRIHRNPGWNRSYRHRSHRRSYHRRDSYRAA